MQFIPKAVFRFVLFLLVGVSASWAGTGEKVTVMTKNMDAGTDLGFVVAYLQTNLLLGVQLTFQEVLKNNYPLRAFLLGQEIAAAKPDVVGLQEATLWRTGPDPDHATDVMVDQLELLLDALAGEHPQSIRGSYKFNEERRKKVTPRRATAVTQKRARRGDQDRVPQRPSVTKKV